MRLIFDIETDGIEASKVHCIVAKDADDITIYQFANDRLDEGVQFLLDADELIGHNIMGYDLPVLDQLYGFDYKGKITDTLIVSRLIFSDLKERDFDLYRAGKFVARNIGSHSLKAWGIRLGELKGDFAEQTDWSEFSQEMLNYCTQDVQVTDKLYKKLQEVEYSEEAIELEHQIHAACLEQTDNGFPFDVEKAMLLYAELKDKATAIDKQLQEKFGGWWESKGVTTPKQNRGITLKDAPYTKIKWVMFNPNSRHHICKKLIEMGWEPKEFTNSNQPKIDEKVLNTIDLPEAAQLKEYLLLQKRIGQLAEGKQAWLKLEKDGLIHGRVTTMGTITSRCSHQNPNVGQVPSTGAPYGHECRELFHAPKGWKLLGMDMSGLELRCLAHFTAIWDEGAYAKALLEGDIHTENQLAAGLPDRDLAKRFIYAFLYGASDLKIGQVVGGSAQQGKKLRERFLAKTPAIKNLREAVAKKVKDKGFLTGLDGRLFPVRSAHSAVNVLLQGTGAILCKAWVVEYNKQLKAAGLQDKYKQVAFVHDEVQLLVKEGYDEQIAKIGIKAIQDTGKRFKFRLPLDGEYKVGSNWAETH